MESTEWIFKSTAPPQMSKIYIKEIVKYIVYQKEQSETGHLFYSGVLRTCLIPRSSLSEMFKGIFISLEPCNHWSAAKLFVTKEFARIDAVRCVGEDLPHCQYIGVHSYKIKDEKKLYEQANRIVNLRNCLSLDSLAVYEKNLVASPWPKKLVFISAKECLGKSTFAKGFCETRCKAYYNHSASVFSKPEWPCYNKQEALIIDPIMPGRLGLEYLLSVMDHNQPRCSRTMRKATRAVQVMILVSPLSFEELFSNETNYTLCLFRQLICLEVYFYRYREKAICDASIFSKCHTNKYTEKRRYFEYEIGMNMERAALEIGGFLSDELFNQTKSVFNGVHSKEILVHRVRMK